MIPPSRTISFARASRVRSVRVALALAVLLAGCFRNKQHDDDFYPRMDPIPVHVKNENFLDMNVAVVSNGVSRRLGLVSGNSSADFKVDWAVANGQGIIITATPIGGRGAAGSGSLNVAPGQVVEFKIGSVLRQSTAMVHDPR
jgi:hypothetical protein